MPTVWMNIQYAGTYNSLEMEFGLLLATGNVLQEHQSNKK